LRRELLQAQTRGDFLYAEKKLPTSCMQREGHNSLYTLFPEATELDLPLPLWKINRVKAGQKKIRINEKV
jgi:hypothetical protein